MYITAKTILIEYMQSAARCQTARELSTEEHANLMLAALRDAGFAVVDKSQFKSKLSAKSMKYLDDMAETEEAMDRKPALKLLLNHYLAMLKAAQGGTDE